MCIKVSKIALADVTPSLLSSAQAKRGKATYLHSKKALSGWVMAKHSTPGIDGSVLNLRHLQYLPNKTLLKTIRLQTQYK